MRDKYRRLAIVLLLLLVGASGFVWEGTRLFNLYAKASTLRACGKTVLWSPPARVFTGLYPNQPDLAVIRYRSDTPRSLQIALDIAGLTQAQVQTVSATPAFQAISAKPPLSDKSALESLLGPRQRVGELHLKVQSGDEAVCEATAPVQLYSRQIMHWYDSAQGDTSRYLAGWITPQADVVRDFVGNGAQWLEQHPASYPGAKALHGYDQGRAPSDDVRNQVNVLFDTLQNVYHMHYAEENVPFNHDATQLVQLPRDILTSPAPTGMCVETTVILAAALERLGMRPYVVIVPGHAFLGVGLGADVASPIEYWETSDLNGGVTGHQANLHGDSEYSAAAQKNSVLQVIDVTAARDAGIHPME